MAETLRDLDITRDELDRFGEAMKKDEFRKLLVEYCEEINDPATRKEYEQDIILLERQRGVEATFIHPEPFYVIKTSADDSKLAFINVCTNELVERSVSKPAARTGKPGIQLSLPHMLSPARNDRNAKGQPCSVYDVIFNPEIVNRAENPQFRGVLTDVACDAVQSNFNVRLDKNNLKFPKLKYKGQPHPLVVRKQTSEPPQMSADDPVDKMYSDMYRKMDEKMKRPAKPKAQRQKTEGKDSDAVSGYTTPKYTITQSRDVDLQEFTNHNAAKINCATPDKLIVEIKLPLLKSSADVVLDVREKSLSMVSERPSKYRLDLTLPYAVDENSGNAKFDPDTKQLVVTLPVRRRSNLLLSDIGRDDSGVDSDSPGIAGSPDERSPPLIEVLQSGEDSAVDSRNSSVRSECEVFRTKVSGFLDSDKHYSSPEFSCHLFNNTLAFTVHVKNVDPNTIRKSFSSDSSVHVAFTSVSSGFFPLHYAFYVKLPTHKVIEADVLVEAWDNNMVLQIPYELCDVPLCLYHVGVDADSALQRMIEEPSVINSTMLSQEAVAHRGSGDEPTVNVEASSDEVKLTIARRNAKEGQEKAEAAVPAVRSKGKSRAQQNKSRSYSESSGDELCESHSPTKGILKVGRRHPSVSRSVSESSVDDYTWLPFENGMSLSDSLIPEEGEVSSSLKKTVRFKTKISTQLYRSNSSILGQKMKNQRKNKNKKRINGRKLSESETSEGEERKKSTETLDDGAELDTKQKTSTSGDADGKIDFKSDLIFDLEDM